MPVPQPSLNVFSGEGPDDRGLAAKLSELQATLAAVGAALVELAGRVHQSPPMLSPTEGDIIRILRGNALKGLSICRRLGQKTSTPRIRMILATLVDRGILVVTRDGYRIAEEEWRERAQAPFAALPE